MLQRKIKEARRIGSGILNMVAGKCFSEKAIYSSMDRNPAMRIYSRKIVLQRKQRQSFGGTLCMEYEKNNVTNMTQMEQPAKMSTEV